MGSVLVVSPCAPEALPPALRPAFLAALETRVRERVRPTDRVYCTEGEVVVWLSSADADGAMRVVQRLQPVVARVRVPSTQPLEVACRIGAAIADSDATSFSDLLAKARLRGQQASTAAAA
jgi:GGDEF domain-containing protein